MTGNLEYIPLIISNMGLDLGVWTKIDYSLLLQTAHNTTFLLLGSIFLCPLQPVGI